jgi:hypothetical protein
MYYMLLDFSDSSFVSDPADGKNCMTLSCTVEGYTNHVIFVTAYCNKTDSSVKGVCGKYGLIDCIHSENKLPNILLFIRRFHKLS